jgi:membrane protein YqaA with SNARE-associated domain
MFEWLSRLFDWITSLAMEMPVYYAAPLMIVVGIMDSSLLSLPEVNDYITVIRVAQNPNEVYYFPLFPAVGSVIGCLILYALARRGEQFIKRRFHPEQLDRVQQLYRRWGLFALAIPALLPPPMPFKIFVATAGAMEYPVVRFVAVVMIARTFRYYFWGVAAFFYRREVLKALDWLKEHFLTVLAVALGLIVLFFVIRWIALAVRSRSPKAHKTEASYSD